MKKLYSNKKFTFIQDRAPSHRGKIIQKFLRLEFKSRVANTGWLPSSLNGNLLGYYFWNKVKEKLYIGRDAEHFESEKSWKTGFSLYMTSVLQMLNNFVKQGNSFDHV